MSKFKVGDRVRVYGHADLTDGAIGVVEEIKGRNELWLRVPTTSANGIYYASSAIELYRAHPKWCRKLKPKKEPRRFWVNVYPGDDVRNVWPTKELADHASVSDRLECIEVVEVKKK